MPATTVSDVLVPGTDDARNDPTARSLEDLSLDESALDLEWAGGVAPGARLLFVHTGASLKHDFADALRYAVDAALAPVETVSFSLCEPYLSAADAAEWTDVIDQASVEGITVVAASGDAGAFECDSHGALVAPSHGARVAVPASLPGVTAVGGTSVSDAPADWSRANDGVSGSVVLPPPPGLFPLDVVWNDSRVTSFAALLGDAGFDGMRLGDAGLGDLLGDNADGGDGRCYLLAASGGGASALYPKPAWQQASGVPTPDHRYVPDIALSAGGGGVHYVIATSTTAAEAVPGLVEPSPLKLTGAGGTSAATPAFAGIVAILNQALVAKGALAAPGLGNINPVLYALQANVADNHVFRDVAAGDTCVPCAAGSPDCPAGIQAPCREPGQFGFAAGPGYDEVTGLGTIDAAKLVSAWTSLLPTSLALAAVPKPASQSSGPAVTLRATVSATSGGRAMSGTVLFVDQTGRPLGAAAVAGAATAAGLERSTAVLDVSPWPAGAKVVFATYTGDASYLGSFTRARPVFVGDVADAGATLVPAADGGAVSVSPAPARDDDGRAP